MDTETNWHRITASLLRENERLQTELDSVTQKYERATQEIRVLRGRSPSNTAGTDTAESEDEDDMQSYEPSETQSELYWTDREYITDDAWETSSEEATEATEDEAEATRPGTPAAIEQDQLAFFETPLTVEARHLRMETNPECSLMSLHRLQDTPSRFVPRK